MAKTPTQKKKKALRTEVLEYVTLFEPQKEGGFVVTVPDLPGCVTQGETFEEAQTNAQEAITLYLEVVGDEEPDLDLYKPSSVFMTPVKVGLRVP